MDLPTEIWVHIITDFFASYYIKETLWLQNVASFLLASDDGDEPVDLQTASIYARQKEVYSMAYILTIVSKKFSVAMQSRQIWKHIFDCVVGNRQWLRKAPQEFEVTHESDYFKACKFVRTFEIRSFPKYALRDNALHRIVVDPTKEKQIWCSHCQAGKLHEHFIKFNARTQQIVELKNWPCFTEQFQSLQAENFYVFTTRDHIILFDLENDCVAHKFSSEMLPRQFHLFFINTLDKKLVFAVQGLGYLLRTLILDIDKGIHITNDDISAFKHWPHTPYYVSKQLNDEFITIKILNDDNTFSTVQLQGDSSSEKFLKTNDASDIFFIDNRMLVWIENKAVYEINPITREIIYTLPAFDPMEIFHGYFVLSIKVDPDQDCTTITFYEVYTNKKMYIIQFRNSLADWNSLLNDEEPKGSPFQFIHEVKM
jgi:hypothetical protein